MDVKTAFLHGEHHKNIFMKQREDVISSKCAVYVCKPSKALYGLKQAPRQRFEKINKFLLNDTGFKSCEYAPFHFVRHTSKCVTILSLYIGDHLLAMSSMDNINHFKQHMCRMFEMKDRGQAKVCNGFQIHRDRQLKNLHFHSKHM